MTENSDDAELRAIQVLIEALSELDKIARERVLAYVFKRLDMQAPGPDVHSSGVQPVSERKPSEAQLPQEAPSTAHGAFTDIRSFAEQKKPRSANEMAAVVAYYLQYEAPSNERKDAINKTDVERYFHLAKFRMPRDGRFTLANSKNAGYLDHKGKGHFSLNPVGYNLVAHKLGAGSGSGVGTPKVKRRRYPIRKKRKR